MRADAHTFVDPVGRHREVEVLPELVLERDDADQAALRVEEPAAR
jgi:hypothetical protein